MIIENAWREYRQKCISDDANVYQLKVMRLAFFAGFATMLRFAKVSEMLDSTVLDAEVKQLENEMALVQ